MNWGWLDPLGRLNIPKILFIAGMIAAALLSVGAAMAASKASPPGKRRYLWVLCAAGAYLAIVSGLIAWSLLRRPWTHLANLPLWAALAWMFINRKSMKATR